MSDDDLAQPHQRLSATIRGQVQGVNFRAYTARKGRELGLTGWVRNRSDGSVETVAEGERAALQSFLDFLHVGSPSAKVTNVDVTWQMATGEFDDFRVSYW